MGTVLFVLSLRGKIPLTKLRLKMWASGILIAVLINLSNFKLMPSMSKLCLLGKDLMISDTWEALMLPKSSSGGGVSVGGKKDSGVLLVRGTLSEIFWPTLTKKALNSLAISGGEFIVFPSTSM
jgi:hypothetical protein